MKKPVRLALIAAAVVLVLVVGGPFVYINLIRDEAPERLSVDDAGAPTPTEGSGPTTVAGGAPVASPASFDGTWTVTAGSQAGYRVKEVLFGQSTTGVGRTTAVTGSMQVGGTSVTAATVTVDMAKVTSDSAQRDGQFRGRIMEVSRFPTAVFTLTSPIALPAVPADGASATTKATGTLLLHGTTKPVTVDITAKRSGGTVAVSGTIPIRFADYGIDDPSGGPASVGDSGDLEFAVAFAKT